VTVISETERAGPSEHLIDDHMYVPGDCGGAAREDCQYRFCCDESRTVICDLVPLGVDDDTI
jgi:hypothetical protein